MDGSLIAAGRERYSNSGNSIKRAQTSSAKQKSSNTKSVIGSGKTLTLNGAWNKLDKHMSQLEDYEFFKQYYSEEQVKQWFPKLSNKNVEEVNNRMNKDLEPYVNNLKKLKYGSDEWFNEREKYFNKMDSYSDEIAEATLNDMNVSLNKNDFKQFSKYIGAGEGYSNTNSDYRIIYDPVSNDRDYDLEERAFEYERKHQSRR